MVSTAICCFIFVLFSLTVVRVKSQFCHGISQYDRCSPNSACACFYIAGTLGVGICGDEFVDCSELVPCERSNNVCHESNHRCVHHPRCHNLPVCYPIPSFNQKLCPSITTTNTTMTTISSTAPIMTTPIATTTVSSSVTPDTGICATATWAQNGQTVAGGNGSGSELNQFDRPFGLFVDENQTIYVADRDNNRIMKWKRGASSGELVAGGKRQGARDDQLHYPIDIVVDQDETLYICDYNNKRVQKWLRDAQSGQTVIKNIAASGIARDNEGSLYVSDWTENNVKKWRVDETIGQVIISGLNRPCLLFVDLNQSIVVADQWNHRVIKVDNGTTQISIVAGIGSSGYDENELNLPLSVAVDQLGTIYVADTKNHRIMRWPFGATSGNVIVGGRGEGSRSDQLSEPSDLSFDSDGNLYVVDAGNNRVQKYSIDKSSC